MFDWNLFPHVDFNKINLDWIADCLKAMVGGNRNQILSKKSDEDFDFEWIDNTGGGSGGTTDYDRLSNRPSINGHTLTGNQSAAQLGLATPSDIPTVPTKTSDLTNDSGFVDASGAAAAAPVQSVNGKTGTVTGLEEEWTVQNMSASDTSVTLQPDTFYIFPVMASLTVTAPNTGMYAFRFTSGATATTLTVNGVTMPDSFSVESGKVYEVNIYQGYGVVTSWTV